MYYEYYQNNSRGVFNRPARLVYVEAASTEEANARFQEVDGCYFDPDFKRDCSCCGNRWVANGDWDKPHENFESVIKVIKETKFTRYAENDERVPTAIVLHADDTLEVFR